MSKRYKVLKEIKRLEQKIEQFKLRRDIAKREAEAHNERMTHWDASRPYGSAWGEQERAIHDLEDKLTRLRAQR